MNVLVTGSKGFVGKNLVENLKLIDNITVTEFDIENTYEELDSATKTCDFVYHLAGVNRTDNNEEFMSGNFGLTSELLKYLEKNNNHCPVLITSSIQAVLDNDYGKSKREAENLLFEFANRFGSKVFVYRLPNLFGKWSKPNYNSVIATWCYNIAHSIDIRINDTNKVIEFAYIDDVVKEFVNCLDNKVNINGEFYYIPTTYKKTLGEVAELIKDFKQSRENLQIQHVEDSFVKKLYSTYLTYLEEDNFSYNLKMNIDERGSFTECLKFEQGQVSINVCKPGITKGNHWHNTKVEKFIVVQGNCECNFRKVGTERVITYKLSSDNLKVIDVPPGYTHNFKNVGKDDLIVLIWCNELFDKENPDTYFEKV